MDIKNSLSYIFFNNEFHANVCPKTEEKICCYVCYIVTLTRNSIIILAKTNTSIITLKFYHTTFLKYNWLNNTNNKFVNLITTCKN